MRNYYSLIYILHLCKGFTLRVNSTKIISLDVDKNVKIKEKKQMMAKDVLL